MATESVNPYQFLYHFIFIPYTFPLQISLIILLFYLRISLFHFTLHVFPFFVFHASLLASFFRPSLCCLLIGQYTYFFLLLFHLFLSYFLLFFLHSFLLSLSFFLSLHRYFVLSCTDTRHKSTFFHNLYIKTEI